MSELKTVSFALRDDIIMAVVSQEAQVMKVCNYLDIQPVQELPGVTKRNVITADDGAPTFCMRVFEVEPGSSTPSHSHAWEHEVFVLSGRGVVSSEEGETPIAEGSVVFVPPDEHHYFSNNSNHLLAYLSALKNVYDKVTSLMFSGKSGSSMNNTGIFLLSPDFNNCWV